MFIKRAYFLFRIIEKANKQLRELYSTYSVRFSLMQNLIKKENCYEK